MLQLLFVSCLSILRFVNIPVFKNQYLPCVVILYNVFKVLPSSQVFLLSIFKHTRKQAETTSIFEEVQINVCKKILFVWFYLLQNKAQNDRESAVLDKLFEQKQQ